MGASGRHQAVTYRTTCPQCASVFRLGADQLDAAQGWVQCSVCGAAFDARPSLLMADGSPLPPVESEPAEALPLPEAALPPAPGTAVTPDEEAAAAAVVAEDTSPRGIAQRETSLELPSIIL